MKPTHGNWTTKDIPIGYEKDIDHDLKYIRQRNKLPKEKNYITNSCDKPLHSINIDHKGRVFLCDCDGWLPFSVGNIDQFNTLDEIYSSAPAKKIIQSVKDKKFTYCATNLCQIEKKSQFSSNSLLSLHIGIDISCNFQCSSCRERIIFNNSSSYLNERYLWTDKIFKIVSTAKKQFKIYLGSNGEPFVSTIYLNLINKLKILPNVSFVIKTNASKIISNLDILDNNFITKVYSWSVSIDAGSQETYEKLRYPGKWENLLDNLLYLKNNSKNISANFTIQKNNFREIIKFIDLCHNFSMHPNFNFLADWGTFHNFEEETVHLPTSPFYDEFKILVNSLPKHLVEKILL